MTDHPSPAEALPEPRKSSYISAGKPCAVHLPERVYDALKRGAELSAGQIAQRLARRPAEMLRVLGELERAGKVKRLAGVKAGLWRRA